jgi:hypothetical protein
MQRRRGGLTIRMERKERGATEGDLEPVYWQGIKVGHIKRYDSRIRIELLRAHMPDKFRRPDKALNVNIDNRQQFIVTPEVADDLARRWRESCERSPKRKMGRRCPVTLF